MEPEGAVAMRSIVARQVLTRIGDLLPEEVDQLERQLRRDGRWIGRHREQGGPLNKGVSGCERHATSSVGASVLSHRGAATFFR